MLEPKLKIYNPSISKQTLGGGHTFRRNLEKALKDKAEFVGRWEDCDIYFISSITIVDPDEVKTAKNNQKKIVLRVDNMPRKSRNSRNNPALRMLEVAMTADAVVYQSEWAQKWIGSYLGVKGEVIYNGVDTNIFYPAERPARDYKVFAYIQYNRDENKRMTEAFDMFSEEWLKNKKHQLWLAGRFSPEIIAAGFDFFRGEYYEYMGVFERPEDMAAFMRRVDILLYPSYSDALPNTVIEARACGCEVWHKGHAGVGEAASLKDYTLEKMGDDYLKLFQKL